ncbi:MAG: hypothetical protein WBZ36_24305 [Candidatus Nitrosopolaris sp.]
MLDIFRAKRSILDGIERIIDRNDEINPSVIPKTRCITAEPTRIFRKLLVM